MRIDATTLLLFELLDIKKTEYEKNPTNKGKREITKIEKHIVNTLATAVAEQRKLEEAWSIKKTGDKLVDNIQELRKKEWRHPDYNNLTADPPYTNGIDK